MTSAQEAAVDAIDKTIKDFPSTFHGSKFADERREFLARDILDALLSPTKKPCAECDETGYLPCDEKGCIDPRAHRHTRCVKCEGRGFVSSPAPIEGMLEQVGYGFPHESGEGPAVAELFTNAQVEEEGGIRPEFESFAIPVFRLPSKVREG